ncbi:hypothetical protein BN12_1350017 [Nostocoides japonicum T1-X7]|uniref:Uncharacterized protein n=1 Tax=Nostocoides japonicum T1-X7 TaxID=1194083 RepID=A0A077LTL3_9MICO|nr:hypothetical protein BN12_1350017 [Tetrasphaera japonica T1-X7]
MSPVVVPPAGAVVASDARSSRRALLLPSSCPRQEPSSRPTLVPRVVRSSSRHHAGGHENRALTKALRAEVKARFFVPPAGFEPALPPPEGGALSPELRGRHDVGSVIRRAP